MRIFAIFCLFSIACAKLQAQDGGAPSTREEQIEDEQAAKAQTLTPTVNRTESRFIRIQNSITDKFDAARLHLQIGGLPVYAGPTLGLVRLSTNSTDRIRSKLWALGSTRHYYDVGAGLKLARLTDQNLILG